MPNTTSNELDLSIIIPFRDKTKMTMEAVKSLYLHGPRVKEILLVSNNSSKDELAYITEEVKKYPSAKVVEYNQPFNYQKINNWSVEQSTGKFILFLNNDTEFVKESGSVLERMLEKASQEDVGMVGCLLLYGDRSTIQHGGVYIRPGILADHMYVGHKYREAVAKAGTNEYPYDIRKSMPMTAVTGAVQMVEHKKFDQVNGYDESFIICGGDVDLCIRLNKAGYQTWFLGGGYIIHKESQSRAFKPVPYNDFYRSYESYITAYDLEHGDPFLPKITEVMQ